MNLAILAIMTAALCYNVYGVLQVGVERATTMQWVSVVVMVVFIVMRVMRLTSRRQ